MSSFEGTEMGNIVEKISTHLNEVNLDPSLSLDRSLLKSLDRGLSDALPKDIVIGLLTQIASLLPKLQQDPAPLASLAEIIANSSSFSFTDVLDIQPPIPLVGGLSIEAPAFNIITLSLIEKAAGSTSEVGILASKLDVVAALINLWLRTESMAVAAKAYNVLAQLLRADGPRSGPRNSAGLPQATPKDLANASGLMWRRIVTDKDVYGLFFSLCSLKTLGEEGQLDKRRKTISQARLLEFLKDFCAAPQVWTSQIRDIEELYGVTNGGGLLDFAAVHMIEWKDDVVMHVSLVDFFTSFLDNFDSRYEDSYAGSEEGITRYSSKGLDFMISRGLHDRTLNYFLSPENQDPLDVSFIYPEASRYVAVYAATHGLHFMEVASATSNKVLQRLLAKFQNTSGSELGNDRAPKEELNLLAHIPRLALLPRPDHESPLVIGIKPSNADVLNTLATIFKGGTILPKKGLLDWNNSLKRGIHERAAARALFLIYLNNHQSFWDDLISTASLIAIKPAAKAALNLLSSLISAAWTTTEKALQHDSSGCAAWLPTEVQLRAKCPFLGTEPLPKEGIAALLSSSAMAVIMPFLSRGPENDSEDAFEMAVAKFEVLRSFADRVDALVAEDPTPSPARTEALQLQSLLRFRIAQGPLGNRGSGEGIVDLPGNVNVATESR